MKKTLVVLITILLVVFFLFGCGPSEDQKKRRRAHEQKQREQVVAEQKIKDAAAEKAAEAKRKELDAQRAAEELARDKAERADCIAQLQRLFVKSVKQPITSEEQLRGEDTNVFAQAEKVANIVGEMYDEIDVFSRHAYWKIDWEKEVGISQEEVQRIFKKKVAEECQLLLACLKKTPEERVLAGALFGDSEGAINFSDTETMANWIIGLLDRYDLKEKESGVSIKELRKIILADFRTQLIGLKDQLKAGGLKKPDAEFGQKVKAYHFSLAELGLTVEEYNKILGG